MRLIDDLADLVLSRRCVGCAELGPPLCASCLRTLRSVVIPNVGYSLPVAAGTWYDGLARDAVIAFKDHGELGLGRLLGVLVADAVDAVVSGAVGVVLVPVPGHRRSTRGYEPSATLARRAAAELRSRGRRAGVVRALTTAIDYAPMKGLGRNERAAGVTGAFRARRPTRLLPDAASVVVVDDVLTTGATLGEAVRALTVAGVDVAAVVACAATPPLDARRGGVR